MNIRSSVAISLPVLLFLFITCETEQSESDVEAQQTSANVAVMDTSNMEMIDGVPVIPTPGAQIDKDKVVEGLEEENISYSEILEAREEDDVKKNIESLEQLLQTDRVRNDKELRVMIYTLLGNSYLKMYEYTYQNSDLDQAEEHLNSAISLFENQPKYKADLADAYTSRIAVHTLLEEVDKALSLRKYLIEEFQEIGYGFYKNWFASREVESLYNRVKRDTLESGKIQVIIDYLSDLADRYENEVGVTAQMALARHFAEEGQQDKAEVLTESVEQQLESLNNPEFKEDKWLQFKTEVESIQKRETESVTLAERDTLFYKIEPKMIDQARITEDEMQSTYRILVQLENDYHSEFAKLTTDNIGNFLAVVYKEEVVSPAFPTIQTGISGGRFSVGPFKRKKDAQVVYQQILNE